MARGLKFSPFFLWISKGGGIMQEEGVWTMEKLSLYLMVGGTGISFLFGQWHISLTILVSLMTLDLITGITKACINGKWRSAIGFKGFMKKVGIMVAIIIANFVDVLSGSGIPVFRTMAVFFYIGLEGGSIIENLHQMGVPIPKGVAKYFEQLSKKEDVDEQSLSNIGEQKES